MDKEKFWTMVFYCSLGVLTLWLFLKISGFIQTPVWLEYGVPVASLILTLFSSFKGVFERLAILSTKFDHVTWRIDHVDRDIDCLKNSVGVLLADVTVLKSDMMHAKQDLKILRRGVPS